MYQALMTSFTRSLVPILVVDFFTSLNYIFLFIKAFSLFLLITVFISYHGWLYCQISETTDRHQTSIIIFTGLLVPILVLISPFLIGAHFICLFQFFSLHHKCFQSISIHLCLSLMMAGFIVGSVDYR
jgi:hypothetical protein